MPPGISVWDLALVPSTASFWLAQLCSSTAGGESHSWPSLLPEISVKGSHWWPCATQLQWLLQPLASLTKEPLQALAPLASLTGLQRKPTLFQKRQLLQALAPLARVHWKPTLLELLQPVLPDQPLRAAP